MLRQFLIEITALPLSLQKPVESQISSGDSCKPFQKGFHYPAKALKMLSTKLSQIVKASWIAACNKLYLHAAMQHPLPIFRSVSTTFLIIIKKHQNKQLKLINVTDEDV
jgi:hypothetical protein